VRVFRVSCKAFAEESGVFSRHTGVVQASGGGFAGERPVYEEYWYDALGRRVMVRSRHDIGCPVLSGTECESYVLRTVWDGDQVLVESRWPGADSVRGYDQPGGMTAQVAYTDMAGLDRPVSVIKSGQTLIPHENWRGVFEDGHLAGTTTHPSVNWPGATQTLDQAPTVAGLTTIYDWWGDVLTGGTDGSGQKYMRNRYYDPSKGTFSQKDPIGLAGGLNLYGYAGSDAVNLSDPYGLAPTDTNPPENAAQPQPPAKKKTWVLGNGCPAIADDCDVDMDRAGPMAAGVLIGGLLAVGGAAVGNFIVRLLPAAAPAAPVVGKGTMRLMEMIEEAGPDLEARTTAVARWLPTGQRALLTPLADGARMLSGGAGANARQIILYPNGETVVKALNVAKNTYEVVRVIKP